MHIDTHHYEMKIDQNIYSGKKIKEYSIKLGGKIEKKLAPTILDRSPQSIVGRKLAGYKNFGDFGGSGAGMIGFLVDPPGNEWIVITIYDTAMHHMLLDGKWVETMYTTIDFFKPDHTPWRIYGVNSKISRDEFTPLIKNSIIREVNLTDTTCAITLEKDGQTHLLEILDTDKRLCPYPGPFYEKKKIVYPKALRPGEKMSDYIVFIEDGGDILLY